MASLNLRHLSASLKMAAVWLRRIAHCRGFGVQSPSAYAFIRYVVNEHYPYYAYDELHRRWPAVSGVRLKMCRLLLRLANYAQADRWAWCGAVPETEAEYIRNGCRRTCVGGSSADSTHTQVGFVAASAPAAERRLFVTRFSGAQGNATADSRTMLIIEGIGSDPCAKALWAELLEDKRASVSFDLYYCGIAFFDRRFKQNYTVNF